MSALCGRYARKVLRQEISPARRIQQTTLRSFAIAVSVKQQDESTSGRPPGKEQTATSRPDSTAGGISNQSQVQRPLIRRQTLGRPQSPNSSNERSPRPGQVLRRAPSSRDGQVLQRSGPRPGGQVLRRAPPRGGQGFGRTGESRNQQSGQRQAESANKKPQDARQNRRRRAVKNDQEGEEEGLQETVDNYISEHLDPSPNPTQSLPYDPEDLTLKDLHASWPNTPLTKTGLSETVVQKIEWLARRLPGGYQTPEQIAERYKKGEFTRFETEEEKKAVLEIAAELAKKDADVVAERRGEVVEARDMAFNTLTSRKDQKNGLFEQVVRGDIELVEKQRYAFMDNVAAALRNNGTYGPVQAAKFMNRVYELIPQGRTQAPPGNKALKE